MADMLGELPTVLPAHWAEQPAHVVLHPTPRLDAPEPLAYPQQQRLQLGGPQPRFDIRLHDRLNAPRSGGSRTTTALMQRQLTRLEAGTLTRTNGEAQLEY